MLVWRVTLLWFCLACFFSFAWALRGHFISRSMSLFMRLTALIGIIAAGLQIIALLDTSRFAPIRSSLSFLLYTVSLSGFWWAVSATRSRRLTVAFSADQPAHLLQTGPYRFVRHPFYAAYSLFWIAGLVAVPRWYLFPLAALMLVSYFCAARIEEAKFANSDLQGVYEGYRSQTGMFLPRLRGRRDRY
jgi:protein-S-isoprenylcysteine O-methyltransferase Ste14